jgi:nucleoside 2-deoxyribosyltransferase
MTVYLASPYSHVDPRVRAERFEAANRAAAALMGAGFCVFSPISHSHPISQCGVPGDWTRWEVLDRWMLRHCDEVVVLTLDGWEASKGVQAELAIAAALNLPVRHLSLAEATSLPELAHVATENAT